MNDGLVFCSTRGGDNRDAHLGVTRQYGRYSTQRIEAVQGEAMTDVIVIPTSYLIHDQFHVSIATNCFLCDIVRDYIDDEHERESVIDAMLAVNTRQEHDFDAAFEERVWEAMGFTPDPFDVPCDLDL